MQTPTFKKTKKRRKPPVGPQPAQPLPGISSKAFESVPLMLFVCDSVSHFAPKSVSESFEFWGVSRKFWLNDSELWLNTIHPDDKLRVLKEVADLSHRESEFEVHYRMGNSSGDVFAVSDKRCPVYFSDGQKFWQGVISAVPSEKAENEPIEKADWLYRTLTRNIPRTGVMMFDHDLRFTFADGTPFADLGIDLGQICGKTIFEGFPRSLATEWARYHQGALAGGFIALERTINGRIFEIFLLPVKNDKGEVYGGMSVWRDVTERKHTIEKLEESEARYRELFEAANDLVYVHDLSGNYISLNSAGERIFGYTREEAKRLSMSDVISPKYIQTAKEMMERKLTGQTDNTSYEIECITKSGSTVTLEINSSVIKKNDKPLAIQGIARDITERKLAQQALIESEAKLRNLFDNANDLIYVLDLEGNILSVNKSIERTLGYAADELRRLSFREIVAPDHRDLAEGFMRQKLQGARQTVFEIDCITKTGRRITIEVNSSPVFRDDKLIAMQGIARDVTERNLAQKALKKSEAELRALFSAMPDVIIIVDRHGYFVKASTNGAPLYRPAEELVGKSLREIFAPAQSEFFMERIQSALNGGAEPFEYCLEIEGETTWFSAKCSAMSEDLVVLVARDITSNRNTVEALTEKSARMADVFENSNDIMYTTDLNGNFTSLNRAGELITGYGRDEAKTMNFREILSPESVVKAERSINDKLQGVQTRSYEVVIVAKDGRRITLELNSRLISVDGKPLGIQGTARDITARKATEQALMASESRYRLLTEGIMHQVWTARPDGLLDFVNSQTLVYSGKTVEAMIGENWTSVVHPEDLPRCLERWVRSLKSGDSYEVDFRLRRSDGVYRWFKALANPGRDAQGKVVKWFGTNTDVHDKKMAEAQLSHIAKHDPLTNLPNRTEFMNHLRASIVRANIENSFGFAVLFLDLDRFKLINDSLGHVVGDKLLTFIAERLRGCVRPRDVVARLGGDEFTILLNRSGNEFQVRQIAERIQSTLSQPFNIDNYEIFTSASIGVVVFDHIHREPEDFLRDADTAMYRAKAKGKARFEVFNGEMHVRNMNLLRVENDLRRAIERNELRVFYQPVVNLTTGTTSEFEALIRWQHPEHGLVSPVEFIDVAEETGIIVPIGQWILNAACRQTAEWRSRFKNIPDLSVSVNLSAKQLMHPGFITQITDILDASGLEPKNLKLEVTETVVMEHSEPALAILNELRAIGICLSTDDFGTGYSSLSYLHKFPFERLKIDRSFINELTSDTNPGEIVKTILMLAKNLRLQAVAEGIETIDQLRHLQKLGCEFGQGYLLARPVEAELAVEVLENGLFNICKDFVPEEILSVKESFGIN